MVRFILKNVDATTILKKKLIEAKGYLLEDYTINTENYSQHNLNDFYYSIKKNKVTGTCAAVASTIVIEYYNYKKICDMNLIVKSRKRSVWQYEFRYFVDLAKKMKIYISEGGGLYTTRFHKVFNPFYSLHDKTMYGHLRADRYIDNYLERERPIVGNFKAPNEENHSMVIIGTYRVCIKYKWHGQIKYDTTTYYVVNDGYHDAEYGSNWRVQYIKEKYLEDIVTVDYLD